LNLSIGGTASSETEQLLFRRLEAAGVAVVAAMGNDYQAGNSTEYPAAYATVFAVGAVAENGRRSSFSNTGQHIALVAPGSNILSTLPMKASPYLDETEYASWSGTSMATPHVSGVAALAAAKFPNLSPLDLKKRLRDTARKLPAMKNKPWTKEYGTGVVDVKNILT
jgi:subtilisin family serine protease